MSKPQRCASSILLIVLLSTCNTIQSFAPSTFQARCSSSTINSSLYHHSSDAESQVDVAKVVKTTTAAMLLSLGLFSGITPVFADEIGRETEAPTLFTGETTMICTKRGPLGACLKTEQRTVENDNDKASKYFRDPADALKEKYSAAQLQGIDNTPKDEEASALIERLKRQSEENKEKNDSIVRQRTLQNDLGANFGPFDRQVVILNSDGETYTLLQGPQAMRLKKAGYIKDKRFVTQPPQSVIDEAAEAPDDDAAAAVRGVLKGIFGSGEE
jgi:hypothetical protein